MTSPDSDHNDAEASPRVVERLAEALVRAEDAHLHGWGPEEENQLYRDIAEAFRPSIHSLEIAEELRKRIQVLYDEVGTPYTGLDDLPGFVQSLLEHPIVEEGLQIRYAHEALVLLRRLHERLGDLVALTFERKTASIADRYLRRATRLYVWGFSEECIVLCGATVEAAYRVRFPDEEMSRLGFKKSANSKHFGLRRYIEAAERAGVFSVEQFQLAVGLGDLRNMHAHGDVTEAAAIDPLDVQSAAKGAIRDAAELLACLFPVVL